MDAKRCRTNNSGESVRDLQLLVERGKQLHDEVVFECLSVMVSTMRRMLRRGWHLTLPDRSLRTLAKDAG